jgi:hypothetical protein
LLHVLHYTIRCNDMQTLFIEDSASAGGQDRILPFKP